MTMDLVEKKNLLDSVDARTRLAGSNKMEILLFSLGTRETFGINVFKVREVGRTPHITKTPNMPRGVEGLVSLRGNVIPVLSLVNFLEHKDEPIERGKTMMVAEYSKRTLGFLVHEVDRIIRVDWEKVRAPESVLSSNQGLITAITELENGTLVSLLDVEQILANAFGEAVVVTQEVEDIISSPIVKGTIINNSDCKILLDQRKYMNKFDDIQAMLGLTDKEKGQVLSINMNNDASRLYKEVWIGLGGTNSAVYATEVSLEEYLAYTTEETEKMEVMQLASELDGNVELAIKHIAMQRRDKAIQ